MMLFLGVGHLMGQDTSSSKSPAAFIAPLESSARVQLDRAESLRKVGPPDEFLEVYRRVMDKYGDRLIKWPSGKKEAPAGFEQYRSVRELAWMRLAALRQTAPEVFIRFRKQMDAQAKAWFDQAATHRDSRLYERIADDLFLSSYGDDALLRLGEIAFERGDYNVARYFWERIAPGLRFVPNSHDQLVRAGNRPLWLPFAGADVKQVWPIVAPLFSEPVEPSDLVYPDTELNSAEVRSRLAMVSILEGNLDRARIEIELLQQLHPEATGTIAGRTGHFHELLRDIAKEAEQWPPTQASTNSTTFQGVTSRNPSISASLRLAGSEPLWSVALPQCSVAFEVLSSYQVRVAEDAGGLLPFHPLLRNDQVIVQTGTSREHIQAFQLRTGEPLLPMAETAPPAKRLYDRTSIFGVPRFAPAANGSTMFFVDGITLVSKPEDRQRHPAKLQAIDLAAERKLLWEFSPAGPMWSDGFALAGPPVVSGPRLYIVLRKREVGRDETHVASLDVRDGRLLWRQIIGSAQPAADEGLMQISHQMLTADQGRVYCNSNDGFVAALDADSGRVRWITAYPRAALDPGDPNRNQLHFFRDLTPCVLHNDVVVVAPTDSNRLFALDATTGIPLWVTPAELAADAVHLLGVAQNRLVVSGECIYWFDIHSGRLLGRYPEPFKAPRGFARPSPRGYGRGMVVDQHVYWPTRDAILVFGAGLDRQSDAWRPTVVREIELSEHGATGGNLVWGRDTLLIAAANRLWAFDTKEQ